MTGSPSQFIVFILLKAKRPQNAPHDHAARPRRRLPIGDAQLHAAAEVFRAAGDPARLRVLEHLIDGAFCVSELAAYFDVPMPTISQQLRVLHHAGLVTRARDGKHVYYELADAHVLTLLLNALDHAGEPRTEPEGT